MADVGFEKTLHAILGTLRTSTGEVQGQQAARPPQPFVTISREAGAGGHTLARLLVAQLNEIDPGDRPWSVFDRELVEKVAKDHQISRPLIESLGEQSHSWLEDFWSGLSFAGKEEHPSEASVYRRVVGTIRALAEAGRVVIVGRGGVYVTRDLPQGVHVRLVAPFEHRVNHMAQILDVSRENAAAEVRQRDRNRQAFFKRYWPSEVVSPEVFTVTLNTAKVTEDKLVGCILPLIQAKAGQPR